jgi:hypothetical protein
MTEVAVDKFKHDAMMPLFDQKMNKIIDGIDWSTKDYEFGRIESSLKTMTQYSSGGLYSEHVIPEFTPISHQLRIGACGPNAVVDMFEILDGLDGMDKVEQMSRLWLYWLARYLVGDTDKDEGSYLRANLHQCNKVGLVLESDFPYVETNLYPEKIEADLYTMASNNRIEGFYSLGSNGKQRGDEIELAVRTNHPVVFGTAVSEQFTKYRGGGQVWGIPSSIKGFHAMLIVGVRYQAGRRQFLLRNSWGKDWGDNGRVWVDEDYVLWSKSSDFWVGTKMLTWN